jgi:hypothetical protein
MTPFHLIHLDLQNLEIRLRRRFHLHIADLYLYQVCLALVQQELVQDLDPLESNPIKILYIYIKLLLHVNTSKFSSASLQLI